MTTTQDALVKYATSVIEAATFFDKICKLSLADPLEALAKLRGFDTPPGLEYLHAAVLCDAARNLQDTRREIHLEAKFYADLATYLPGAEKCRVKLIKGHKPDGFVRWNREVCPVEVKRGVFDHRALAQLTRYMKKYGSTTGIAVAPNFNCDTPHNVVFIKASL